MKNILNYLLIMAIFISACTPEVTKSQTAVEIHDIQGCSHISPYKGILVNKIMGVVTHKISNGFTMQAVTPDDQFCSSEGIFVFTKTYPDVMVGDLVSVNGSVEEFTDGKVEDHNLSQTEIVQPDFTIIQSDHDLPVPIILDELTDVYPRAIIDNDQMTLFSPNEDGLDFYESLEFMLVEIHDGVVVAPQNGYKEIIVLPESFYKNNLISEQGALLNARDDANPEKIMVKMPTSFKESVSIGDRFTNPIMGVMDYSYGNYKILAFPPIEILTSTNIIDPFSIKADGLTIATYNLENLSPMDEKDKFTEIAKQLTKILQSPDILVLNEVMDNSGSEDDGEVKADKTIEKLVKAIQNVGGPEYRYSDTPPFNNQDGGIEGGNIRTVLLFREDKGIVLEEESASVNGIRYSNGHFLIDQNPVLLGEFSSSFNGTRKPRIWLLNQNGHQFFVVGVHLTSQNASSPDWGNQQPPQKPEDAQRVEEAALINKELSKILRLDPLMPIFIAGDLNDLAWSAAINTLQGDNFINTADKETPAENYSYIFEGNAQQLDYIMINKNLAGNIVQTRFVHLNSFLDHDQSISDHDPLIVEVTLDQ